MARKFPHLDGDTAFPHLSNVDVWQYANNFDYSRYEENARLKLASVPWDSAFEAVVAWKGETDRDEYLDALPALALDESTRFLTSKDGEIKLPVPFNVAARYNYLIADFPVIPDASDPLAHTPAGQSVTR